MLLHPIHKSSFSLILALLTVLLVHPAFLLYGQNESDCTTKIQEARKSYDQGNIEDIPKMLAPCMENGFTRVQKIEAYKLIILSYLVDEDQADAEKTMLEFLKKYPEYEIMPNDPVEFVYLFESYRTTSVFSFGLTAGVSLTDPRIIQSYSVVDQNHVTLKNSMKPGFQIGFGGARYISKQMLFNLEFIFGENRYGFSSTIKTPLQGGNDGINSTIYTEKQFKLELPVTLAYEFSSRKVHYFLRAGASIAKIMGTSGVATHKYSAEMPAITGDNVNMKSYRRNFLYSAVVGTGLRYKVPRGVVIIDLRANIGLNNIVKKENRYSNQQQITKSYYIDDDFSLNTISLTAGYYFSFYKPKKQALK
jgi:hypothetical protein